MSDIDICIFLTMRKKKLIRAYDNLYFRSKFNFEIKIDQIYFYDKKNLHFMFLLYSFMINTGG